MTHSDQADQHLPDNDSSSADAPNTSDSQMISASLAATRTQPTAEEEDSDDLLTAITSGELQHGCEHYKRRCQLVAPCCGEPFWCRHCHNRDKNDEEQDPRKRHLLDRKSVKEVICALCHTRQPVASQCRNCHVQFGKYACMKCNFFDDDLSKRQFHCDDCGICRVGGREKFFHCKKCNCCYATSLRDAHVCVEDSMHRNCPVCFEYLFDSVKNISVMPCGHTIHMDCLKLLFDHSTYSCPMCYRSTVPMDRIWREMDDMVQGSPMPEEYAQIEVKILCNDCGNRSVTKFHIYGHKCSTCDGYNTRRV